MSTCSANIILKQKGGHFYCAFCKSSLIRLCRTSLDEGDSERYFWIRESSSLFKCLEINFISPRMDLYLRFSKMAHEIAEGCYGIGEDVEHDEIVINVNGEQNLQKIS